MNERENAYRGCRLHRYLVAAATPPERQALREAIQRVITEGATQIVLLSCYEVDTISRLDAARLRRAAEKRRARRIRQLIQTVCCWLSAACLFIAWGVAGSVECGTRPMCWATALHMTGWIAAFGIFAWIGGLMDTKYKTLMAERPEFAMELAVKGMLPKNTIGRTAMTRLKLFKGPEHIHAAQKPEAWTQD